MKQKKPVGIIADLFDYWSGHIDAREFAFYRDFVARAKGPVLEGASGTGRILLPLLKEGFLVEGLESSAQLRAECKRQAIHFQVIPSIYPESMEEFTPQKQYALIFVTLGSFQLIKSRSDAELALLKFYNALGPGGRVLISLFFPWMDKPMFESKDWRIVSDTLDKKSRLRFVRREKSYHDPVEQCIHGKVRYEVWQRKELLEWRERELFIRWYSHYEFVLLLEKIGFSGVQLHRSYRSGELRNRDFMIFEAEKPF